MSSGTAVSPPAGEVAQVDAAQLDIGAPGGLLEGARRLWERVRPRTNEDYMKLGFWLAVALVAREVLSSKRRAG